MKEPKSEPIKQVSNKDVHSFSEPESAFVTRLDWDADLNFEDKIISKKIIVNQL